MFKAQEGATGEPFVVSMPPPNVTGALHMGHAMFVTLEDIMVQYTTPSSLCSCCPPQASAIPGLR